ncbi:MAG: prepilin peptidase [Alphaproteobacteria bacterium]|nr:prepilin peptidase [Alphaproteobacteria bacterium]
MPPASELAAGVIVVLCSAVLMLAAASDICDRKIPNRLVLAVLLLFVLWRMTGPATPLPDSLLAGGIVLAVGFPLFVLRIIGAGDTKLAAATALFAGLARLSHFVLAMSLVGGALAILALGARYLRKLRGGGETATDDVPYGVAIAIAGIVAAVTPG